MINCIITAGIFNARNPIRNRLGTKSQIKIKIEKNYEIIIDIFCINPLVFTIKSTMVN
jgi:hypothetical protein